MKLTRRQARADIPSVAMGDIAFNLLIFFVILARAQDDSHLQWTPAKASDLESAGQSKASVLVDRENKLYFNGQETGIAELRGRIEAALGDLPPGQRTVLLKIHDDTTALRFEPIIEAVSQAGGDLVHIVDEDKSE